MAMAMGIDSLLPMGFWRVEVHMRASATILIDVVRGFLNSPCVRGSFVASTVTAPDAHHNQHHRGPRG
jgi:hypothetical protein